MLDDFIKEQPIVYKILKNSIKKERNSHAYLFETRGYSKGLDLAISYVKYLLCPTKYSNNQECGECTQCKIIDDNNYIELKIIEPDGSWIKKEQLSELQQEFNKKALNGTKKVYIINHADKLNVASSNSILKFLEEPEENIIAILIVDNQYQLLKTISSRCQIISFINHPTLNTKLTMMEKLGNILISDRTSIEEYAQDERNIEKVEKAIEFVNYYEKNRKDTLLNIQSLWNSVFNDKENIDIALQIITLYYIDILNICCNRPIQIFEKYKKEISIISNKNTDEQIIDKINAILEQRQNLIYNMNTNLLLDKLILTWEGIMK